MPKVTFTKNREVLDHDGNVTESYEAGKTYDLPDNIAYRYIRRQIAHKATEKPKPKEKPPEKKEKDETTFAKRKPPITQK